MKKIIAAITLMTMILCSVASAQKQRSQVTGTGSNIAYASLDCSNNARLVAGSRNYRIISQKSSRTSKGATVTRVIEYDSKKSGR